jgi:hypothetical protein
MLRLLLENKMAERKDRFALLGVFDKFYMEKFGRNPDINKYNEQWAADALLESFGKEGCYKALEYYFRVSDIPSWKSFSRGADRLLQSMQQEKEDAEYRRDMRKKAKEWLGG